MAGTASSGRRTARWVPYAMVAPTMIFLVVFFVIPIFTLFKTSLSVNTGSLYVPVQKFNWEWGNYSAAFTQYREEIVRSFSYAGLATAIMIVLAYPLAYVLAFKAGRWKNLMLGMVILPFFITFLVRTIAWKTILADDGFVVDAMGAIGLLPAEGRILSTPWAVIGGLVYNFLPFMVLPIYVSLEKIDPRLIEASRDLYSSTGRGFRKVILPLSMPGVLAGSLLCFIPASGDFINAEYLGSTKTTMMGTVIQKQFLIVKDYPTAAAMSFVLMAIVLAMVLVYTRALGTEDLV
ncbi:MULTISPECIES: ABC transporter permease [Candidatus Microthrix]|jgi:spermidine/putrescine transport system permease protein|uniref:ABC-type spermidine/putrescine transport system, permease component I n=1 Tax=Candidatus Neomicrothrix parvicella RN1 TaxID=1229780 RepID=R4Z117_9ACTN|nr:MULTISPECIES: ABC transporter permease [Microthrix]NLH65223.1 ABC transporter permease [Candidatus Microthrix parvicella]MBK6502554.1 ABC transporter permease [Candidatus Microthrix sp.]MBK7020255.1 ABC transporter permease [Candidatus Microthrix sp.]MBK7323940.1 ABC transporter permease [Candidatus Microthrix sp.]MBL0203073.1 ABC transporter permease [Candidatus Microthrix sp.]